MNLLRPLALSTDKPGSFARRTIEQRKHKLITDIISTGILTKDNINELIILDNEISNGLIGNPEQIFNSCALIPNEKKAWETAIIPLVGRKWLEVPWYQAEAYFYLRVLSATGYYDKSSENYALDSFRSLKSKELLNGGMRIASWFQGK